jgi:hypothetical protein
MYIPDLFVSVLSTASYSLDVLIYSSVVWAASYLPDWIQYRLYHLLFTVDSIGSQEKGDCVFLVNYSHPISNRLLFETEDKCITTSTEEALRMAEERGCKIQTVLCYQSRDYFVGGWVYPQPFELIYEYGEVGIKTENEYREYFFEKLTSRPGARLYYPDLEQSRLLFVALLCSKYSMVMVYLLLRYQWYNRKCFQSLLIASVLLCLVS